MNSAPRRPVVTITTTHYTSAMTSSVMAARLLHQRVISAAAAKSRLCSRLVLQLARSPPAAVRQHSRHLTAAAAAAAPEPQYPPPFTSAPFSPPPPPRPDAPPVPDWRSMPPMPIAMKVIAITLLTGFVLACVFIYRNNGGFPKRVLSRMKKAQQLIAEADGVDPSAPDGAARRAELLQQAEKTLKEALDLTGVRDPVQPTAPYSNSALILSVLPTMVDPVLPPRLYAMLGRVCSLQGERRYRHAEYYFSSSLRELVDEQKKEEQRVKEGTKGRDAGTKDYFDSQLLSVGRQLGWLYYLMGRDVSAETVMFRCLQLIADIREREQKRLKRLRKQQAAAAPASSSLATSALSAGRSGFLDPHDYDDDVTAELSEQLSAVFRLRGDHTRAVEWAANALKMNDKAERAASQERQQEAGGAGSDAAAREAETERAVRALHLYSALASDKFALHLAAVDKPAALPASDSEPTFLDDAYHAAVHALETLDALIAAADSAVLSPSLPPSSAAAKRSSRPKSQQAEAALAGVAPKRSARPRPRRTKAASPHLASPALPLLPPDAHTPFLSSAAVSQVFSLPASASRSSLLTEVVAAYSNLAVILCGRGEEADADTAWRIADEAAELQGDESLKEIISEQQQMMGWSTAA